LPVENLLPFLYARGVANHRYLSNFVWQIDRLRATTERMIALLKERRAALIAAPSREKSHLELWTNC
jgi:hypothetical protein